ncbi:hypothetical protein [Rhodopirellula bahusiensis]|uniref:Uncharacterized protein n=1 Tax=Rhodopirellula bahusiensis TaxID=2014065 RepID=A0A2G1WBN9_9BACT|nr:hypothetical protein [Rhodopirellula bahusiensis]PHQ36447.1 hypothetical protein CEE69_03380 [Rhodopirellula bahusiensis]
MSDVANNDPMTLRFRDPLLFLFGVESSIRRVLRCRWSILLGGALVATASMAREYDAVSWLDAPLDLLGPFAASLVISMVLFFVVQICLAMTGYKRDPRSNPLRDYRIFLIGYWMTAPLAWFYAVPIEVMADEVTSLRFNLTMLSIVSIWRVLLFSRVIAVQFGLRWWATLSWILVPCMVIAFFALLSAQLSMVSIMGGIRLTQTQQILSNYQSAVAGGCFYGIIPVFIAALGSIAMSSSSGHRSDELGPRDVMIERVVWVWPLVPAVILLVAASFFQPKLRRSAKVDSMLRRGDINEAISIMQASGQDAFPIVWDPPPKYPDRGEVLPEISLIVDAIEAANADPWIMDRLMVQADEIALRQEGWYQGTADLEYVQRYLSFHDLETIERMLNTLEQLRSLEVGDQETREHRLELIRVIEAARAGAIERKEAEESEADVEETETADDDLDVEAQQVDSDEQIIE